MKSFADLTVTAAPSQHFSGRGLKDRNATLWSSLVIRSARHAVFFSGDTGLTTRYAEIRERLGPFDLVMLEVGAFHPSWRAVDLPQSTMARTEPPAITLGKSIPWPLD
jgi:L-ascorbate metabolism protein UlaG (beta-lactamase superfamily)